MIIIAIAALASSVALGLLMTGIVTISLGLNPVDFIGGQLRIFLDALAEPRLAAYAVVFALYLIELPVMLVVVRRHLFIRLLLAVGVFALMHAAFYLLQYELPLNGYEELMLVFCTVFGFFWIIASALGAVLAERITQPTRS